MNHRKYSAAVMAVAAILVVGGCHKKAAPPPPPPPPSTAPAPTASITAAPTSINPGDKAVLTWQTTGASDVSIEGMGPVSPNGTQIVTPTQSTTYHLVVRGDGGSTDASARVTVTQSATPPPEANNGDNNIDDATFHQNVQDIYFDYDSYDLNPQAQPIATKDAGYLAAHPQLRVVIGGYCDERGSTEFNLALGENRANAAKQALISAGVSPDRIRTVSYGKEKQFCNEHSESCWQQNRRAQFSLDR